MEKKEIIKEYKNGELTIAWKPQKCIHAAICVQELPKVYNATAKPWLTIENASTKELQEQIKKCPSGALSYTMMNEEETESVTTETKVNILLNGPLMVFGTLEITHKDGDIEIKEKATAFCRCGASENKPYCDGAHKKIEFTG
ncbi:MAG: (4Fe-4S)-binding protein [Cellulophaga sp.]